MIGKELRKRVNKSLAKIKSMQNKKKGIGGEIKEFTLYYNLLRGNLVKRDKGGK